MGHPCKFQRVSHLGSVTAPMSLNGGQPNFARCLAVCRYMTYTISGVLAPIGILQRAKFTLRPGLAFSYINRVTARHSSSGRQPNFAAWDKKVNYGTFAPRLRHLNSAGRPSRWASVHILVMVALFSSCFFFLSFFLSSFFPRLISAVGDWMFTILWHMVWP